GPLHFLFAAITTCLLMIITGQAIADERSGKTGDPPERTLRGIVTEETNGRPLAGATVTLKGTNTVSLTDAEGRFSIVVPDNNAVLVISFVGYTPREIEVGNAESLTISLQPVAGDLGEVVVVGYGTQSRKDVTGAVKTLKAEEFNKGIINTPQQLLQGKVAGVNVTSATGEPGGA